MRTVFYTELKVMFSGIIILIEPLQFCQQHYWVQFEIDKSRYATSESRSGCLSASRGHVAGRHDEV